MSDPSAKDQTVIILGISKKMHLELAEMEIQDHVAVVNVLTQLCQHRVSTLEKKLAEDEKARQREAAFGAHKVGLIA